MSTNDIGVNALIAACKALTENNVEEGKNIIQDKYPHQKPSKSRKSFTKKEQVIIICNYTDEEVTLLANGHVQTSEGEMSLQQWLRNATGWPSVQTYVFAIHKETGKTLQQLRKEYGYVTTNS